MTEKGLRELWENRPRPGMHSGIDEDNIRRVFRHMVATIRAARELRAIKRAR